MKPIDVVPLAPKPDDSGTDIVLIGAAIVVTEAQAAGASVTNKSPMGILGGENSDSEASQVEETTWSSDTLQKPKSTVSTYFKLLRSGFVRSRTAFLCLIFTFLFAL